MEPLIIIALVVVIVKLYKKEKKAKGLESPKTNKKKEKYLTSFAEKNISAGEKVLKDSYVSMRLKNALGPGRDMLKSGVFILTDKRVIFYTTGLFGTFYVQDIQYSKISSVRRGGGMFGVNVLELHASGADLVVTSKDSEFVNVIDIISKKIK